MAGVMRGRTPNRSVCLSVIIMVPVCSCYLFIYSSMIIPMYQKAIIPKGKDITHIIPNSSSPIVTGKYLEERNISTLNLLSEVNIIKSVFNNTTKLFVRGARLNITQDEKPFSSENVKVVKVVPDYIINAHCPFSKYPNHMFGLLLVAVVSASDNFARREMIRNVFDSQNIRGKDVGLVFFLGKPNDSRVEDKIQYESKLHKDIVQTDILDTYRNLTFKTISMVRWMAENCNRSKM